MRSIHFQQGNILLNIPSLLVAGAIAVGTGLYQYQGKVEEAKAEHIKSVQRELNRYIDAQQACYNEHPDRRWCTDAELAAYTNEDNVAFAGGLISVSLNANGDDLDIVMPTGSEEFSGALAGKFQSAQVNGGLLRTTIEPPTSSHAFQDYTQKYQETEGLNRNTFEHALNMGLQDILNIPNINAEVGGFGELIVTNFNVDRVVVNDALNLGSNSITFGDDIMGINAGRIEFSSVETQGDLNTLTGTLNNVAQVTSVTSDSDSVAVTDVEIDNLSGANVSYTEGVVDELSTQTANIERATITNVSSIDITAEEGSGDVTTDTAKVTSSLSSDKYSGGTLASQSVRSDSIVTNEASAGSATASSFTIAGQTQGDDLQVSDLTVGQGSGYGQPSMTGQIFTGDDFGTSESSVNQNRSILDDSNVRSAANDRSIAEHDALLERQDADIGVNAATNTAHAQRNDQQNSDVDTLVQQTSIQDTKIGNQASRIDTNRIAINQVHADNDVHLQRINSNSGSLDSNQNRLNQNQQAIYRNDAASESNYSGAYRNYQQSIGNRNDSLATRNTLSTHGRRLNTAEKNAQDNEESIGVNSQQISAHGQTMSSHNSSIVRNLSAHQKNAKAASENASKIETNRRNVATNTVGVAQNRSSISGWSRDSESNQQAIKANDGDIARNATNIQATKSAMLQNRTAIQTNNENRVSNTNRLNTRKNELSSLETIDANHNSRIHGNKADIDRAASDLGTEQNNLDRCMYTTQYCIPQNPDAGGIYCTTACTQSGQKSTFRAEAKSDLKNCRQGCTYDWSVPSGVRIVTGCKKGGSIGQGGSVTTRCVFEKSGVPAEGSSSGTLSVTVRNAHYTDRTDTESIGFRFSNTTPVPVSPIVSTWCDSSKGCNQSAEATSFSTAIQGKITNCKHGCRYSWSVGGNTTKNCPSGTVSAGRTAMPRCTISKTGLANESKVSGTATLSAESLISSSHNDSSGKWYQFRNTTPNFNLDASLSITCRNVDGGRSCSHNAGNTSGGEETNVGVAVLIDGQMPSNWRNTECPSCSWSVSTNATCRVYNGVTNETRSARLSEGSNYANVSYIVPRRTDGFCSGSVTLRVSGNGQSASRTESISLAWNGLN